MNRFKIHLSADNELSYECVPGTETGSVEFSKIQQSWHLHLMSSSWKRKIRHIHNCFSQRETLEVVVQKARQEIMADCFGADGEELLGQASNLWNKWNPSHYRGISFRL